MAKQTENQPKVVSQAPTRSHKLNIKPVDEVEIPVIKFDSPEVVERMQQEYPEMSTEYLRIVFTAYELFCKKNLDYGISNIALGTSLSTDEERKISLTGVWFRLMDKLQRLKSLVVIGNKQNVNESIEDTYMDILNYSVISQIIASQKWGK
jgi:hypothetical protein